VDRWKRLGHAHLPMRQGYILEWVSNNTRPKNSKSPSIPKPVVRLYPPLCEPHVDVDVDVDVDVGRCIASFFEIHSIAF